MLNVWIMLRVVGDEVVNVVAGTPPANREASEVVCNEDGADSVHCMVMCDTRMASVVSSKGQLMPEESQEKGRSDVVRASALGIVPQGKGRSS